MNSIQIQFRIDPTAGFFVDDYRYTGIGDLMASMDVSVRLQNSQMESMHTL